MAAMYSTIFHTTREYHQGNLRDPHDAALTMTSPGRLIAVGLGYPGRWQDAGADRESDRRIYEASDQAILILTLT